MDLPRLGFPRFGTSPTVFDKITRDISYPLVMNSGTHRYIKYWGLLSPSGMLTPEGVTKRCRLSWLTNSALVHEPKCGGKGGILGSQQMSTAVHRSPNKLWRSNSIFNLWLTLTGPGKSPWCPLSTVVELTDPPTSSRYQALTKQTKS